MLTGTIIKAPLPRFQTPSVLPLVVVILSGIGKGQVLRLMVHPQAHLQDTMVNLLTIKNLTTMGLLLVPLQVDLLS